MMREMMDTEQRILKDWAASLEADMVLRYAIAGHAADDAFVAFVNRMTGTDTRVKAKRDGDTPVDRPTLFAGPRVAYQAVPADRELECFLRVLKEPGAFADGIDVSVREALARLRMPAPVSVFITPGCPFCPTVVAALLGLAALNDNVWLTIIDGAKFPDAVEAHRITAAPTVILDDQLRWTGQVDVAEVVAMMLDRDPVRLSAGALKGMIEGGDADAVARMMIERQKIFPAFIDLLTHPRWSVRLGAMVAFETLVEAAPDLAGEVIEPLMAAYPDLDDTTRGDLLYILGVSGRREVLPFLTEIGATAEDPEVRNAAGEAIAALTSEPDAG